MRSGHSKLLVQRERSVRTSSPKATHTNKSRLKQPHGILTPWLTNTKISHHLRRHTWTHALNVFSDLLILLSLFIVFIRCLCLDVCVELIKASGLVLGLRPGREVGVFSWTVLNCSFSVCAAMLYLPTQARLGQPNYCLVKCVAYFVSLRKP